MNLGPGMNEPSVLDYVKSKIFFWRGVKIDIPQSNGPPQGDHFLEEIKGMPLEGGAGPDTQVRSLALPAIPRLDIWGWVGWWAVSPLTLALIAQLAFEPPKRFLLTGLAFYLIAVCILIFANLRARLVIPSAPEPQFADDNMSVRSLAMWFSLGIGLLAFLALGGNLFTQLNVSLWGISLALFIFAFWKSERGIQPVLEKMRIAKEKFRARGIVFSPWTLTVLAVFFVSAFFRFYQLGQLPSEMFSDHAEKLLDVANVLDGQYNIFFPRNTGREAIQMYLTAAVSLFFGTGLSFMSLKIGTTLAGLLTIPFIYWLGKEVANRRVGLFAMAFAGLAYWPNVISRVALRFALYPLFTAPVLYFLVRGLRRGTRNDFILAGLFLGLGLHGYSPFRFVPFVVLLALGLYLLHQRSQSLRQQTLWGGVLLIFTSLLVFLPLLRFAISNSEIFSYRMLTRMTDAEIPIVDPIWQIFLKNFWDALSMLFWDNGEIWVHSIPDRPALGMVSAALFFIGVVLLVVRYVRERQWMDLFWLLSIPMLMMPSILSLAFPAENPSLNRTGGAMIPVFLIVGLALDGLWTNLKGSLRSPAWGQRLAWSVAILLLVWSGAQNYNLVFKQYKHNFTRDSWNTSEIGAVIRQFADTIGTEETAWVVPFPHWVDTRLVGLRAGTPGRDYALWSDQIQLTADDPRTKLFIVKPEDGATLKTLRDLYPLGSLELYDSNVAGREFYLYFVPPVEQ
jgi:4-amino-4-deoxy-L-arabinose transferase-like glycosyltransferase